MQQIQYILFLFYFVGFIELQVWQDGEQVSAAAK